ncbi:MAG: DUF1670 domain-containing protein [Ignavibacteria bacterium]|nr:DUF1670 domain-containing protein [Ignavibacteria bacterium]
MRSAGNSPDIIKITFSVDRYIKHYEQVKKLLRKGMDEIAIVSITGRSLNFVRQYIKLYKNYNPQKINNETRQMS